MTTGVRIEQRPCPGKRCRVYATTITILLVLTLAGIVFKETLHSLNSARNSQALRRLAQLRLALENYQTIHGRRLSRISIDREGNLRSWREVIADYFDDTRMHQIAAQPKLADQLNRPLQNSDAPESLRVPYDLGDPRHTSLVGVYDDDDNREVADALWAVIAIPNSGIPWLEPRDFSTTELLRLLDSYARQEKRVDILMANGQLVSIEDGYRIHFSLEGSRADEIRSLLLDKNR